MNRAAHRAAAALASTLVLALAACGGAGSEQETITAGAGPKGGPPSPAVPKAWPLTGIPSDQVVARPALAIKVENSAAARPQTGLEQADLVWEEVVEGGITRFIAVYHSAAPEQVGPVRSVRPTDPPVVAPLAGLLVYTGGQPPFIDAVGRAGIQSIIRDEGDPGFVKVRGRRAPHNIAATPADLWQQADANHKAPPGAQFSYARAAGQGTASVKGTPATTLEATLSPSSKAIWTWSAPGGVYQRAEGTRPAVSMAGVRLAAKNVVILRVTMVNTKYKDPAGAPVPESKLAGSGAGFVASGGKILPITWSKTGLKTHAVLRGPDGAVVRLEQGNTWIELIPTTEGGAFSAK